MVTQRHPINLPADNSRRRSPTGDERRHGSRSPTGSESPVENSELLNPTDNRSKQMQYLDQYSGLSTATGTTGVSGASPGNTTGAPPNSASIVMNRVVGAPAYAGTYATTEDAFQTPPAGQATKKKGYTGVSVDDWSSPPTGTGPPRSAAGLLRLLRQNVNLWWIVALCVAGTGVSYYVVCYVGGLCVVVPSCCSCCII